MHPTTTTSTFAPPTRITTEGTVTTALDVLHVEPSEADAVSAGVLAATEALAGRPGTVALDVLRSTDSTRVLLYGQWQDETAWQASRAWLLGSGLTDVYRPLVVDGGLPRVYDVVHADDRSADGVTVIDPSYAGAVFVNEITTRPEGQARLVDLVVANNDEQSLGTPGYRSANFHRSRDGRRVVNYSLWDSEAHAVDAISRMADMDRNLEETLELASPDFRFYDLVHHWHAPVGEAPPVGDARYRAAVARVTSRLTPQARQQVDAVYRFRFTDSGTSARLDARREGEGWVEEPTGDASTTTAADFTVDLSRDDFAALVHGELHPMAGMATGRMRLRGSMRRAMVLDRLLKG